MPKDKNNILSEMNLSEQSSLEELLEKLEEVSIVNQRELQKLRNLSVYTLPTVVRNKEDAVKEKMYGIVANEDSGAIALINKRNVLLEQVTKKLDEKVSNGTLPYIKLIEGTDDTKISTLYSKFSNTPFVVNYNGPSANTLIIRIEKQSSLYRVYCLEPLEIKNYIVTVSGDTSLSALTVKMDYPSDLATTDDVGVINLGEIDSPYITNNEKLNAIKDTTKLYSFTYSRFPYLMQIYSPEGVTYYQHIYCINSTADNAGKPRIYTRKINSDSTVKLLGYTEIPTKVSQLEQDIEFISEEQVTEIVTNNFKKLSVSELKDGIKYAKYLGKYDLVMDEQANDGYGGVKRFIQRIYNEYGIVRNEYGGYITTIYYAELIGYRGNMDATGHYIIFQEGTSFYCFKMPAHASMRICAYTIDVVTPDNINGIQLKNYEMYPLKSEIPTKVSQLENDSEFINNSVNNLVNYYLKTETYTKQEVLDLIGQISTMSLKVVTALPTTDISTTTIYLVLASNEEMNIYEEYVYINGNWELIGTTKIDLTGYVQSNSNVEFKTVNATENITIKNEQVALKKELFSKNYNDLINKPTIPTNNNQLENGAEYIQEEQVMEIVEENSEEVETLLVGTSNNYNVESDEQIPTSKAVKAMIENAINSSITSLMEAEY